ncbi:MAG: putative box helicase domain protein [Candidatus Saccharibacteria bacterium]|nr:putative box helicase domain protein [Candidatus Saccharibacteria bacterium]
MASAFSSRRTSRPTSRPGVRSFSPNNRSNRSGNRGAAYIHPSKFINKAVAAADEVIYESKHQFSDFPFNSVLAQNIVRKGYVTPSAIQDQTIPYILDGKDVIGLANTGTGKTAAFVLPIIERLSNNGLQPSVLIMAPTRELAQQIDEEFRTFASGMKLFSTIVVGGMNIERQIRDLKRHPHVVIGTPGRLKDLMNRRALDLSFISTLVLDEADRMLDMGFINDIKTILAQTPSNRQTLFFSATITPTIQTLVQQFLNDPITVSVRTAETSEHVEQDIVQTNSKEEKLDRLVEMLGESEYEKVLIFGETKYGVQRLSDHLTKVGHPSAAIHGNKSQSQRQKALNSFKKHEVKVLVATDVAARGLDIPNVSHVINFDQPATYEDYIHRIGRTGRGGAKGKALTFVSHR